MKFLIAITFVAVVGAAFVPRIPQPMAYHHFADQRMMFGVPSGANVLSNLGFLIAGIWGLVVMLRRGKGTPVFKDVRERLSILVFFAGVLITAFGSAYYHLSPDNPHLVWDRLPITVAFMSLTAAMIGERMDVGLGRKLLWPLMFVGAASVFYWSWTERLGRGDLRPYLLVQFLPMVIILLLVTLFPARYTGTGRLGGAVAFYILAKVAELQDARIYAATGFLSGHTLKHLLAAVGCGLIVWMVAARRPVAAAPASL